MSVIQDKRPGPKSQKGKGGGKATAKTDKEPLIFQTSTLDHSNLDKTCLYDFSKGLYRIQYPGCVKNFDEALRTLGGISGIENSIADARNKLELHFHPDNLFNKGCFADRDQYPGILIKVKQKPVDTIKPDDCPYDYEAVGATTLNFTFNNMCDYQYLPLLAKDLNETVDSDVENVYEKVLPKEIPNMKWFLQKEITDQPKFCVPPVFGRFDHPQNRIFLNAGERFESYVRPDIVQNIKNAASAVLKPKRKRIFGHKQFSFFVDFTKPNVKVPDQPLAHCMNLIKERFMEKQYISVEKLFRERPIWTKVAVQYHTNLCTEYYKILLPAVAYFCNVGPWRHCWIRYGYNPLEDINSRIYQVLDFRIRAAEGLKLKINAKRGPTKLFSGPTKRGGNTNTLMSGVLGNIKESYFLLKPNTVPPARQMMYQFCDIRIPEVQEMLSRLPKLQTNLKFHGKYGWLPVHFTDQCREIANQYIMSTVQDMLLKDNTNVNESPSSSAADDQSKTENVSRYASKMLANLRKGVYGSEAGESLKSVDDAEADLINLAEGRGKSTGSSSNSSIMKDDDIDTPTHRLKGDDDEFEQIDAYEFVNSIPAHIPENSDEDSDLEIDAEALEEVNQMVMGIQDEDDVNIMSRFLKDL